MNRQLFLKEVAKRFPALDGVLAKYIDLNDKETVLVTVYDYLYQVCYTMIEVRDNKIAQYEASLEQIVLATEKIEKELAKSKLSK